MKIALYYRLSIADGDLGKDDKEESNSIENQRLLLTAFVEAREDLEGEISEYIDDGYSGTNFERPSFKEMLEDAKKGRIQVIIVKDLSRLGRDYIGVGDYLEQIFPVLGIRFIAVNSNYDSNNYVGKTMGLEMSISNLVNSLYSKDLSKKYRSAVRTKWKQGLSTQGRVPYGYIKSNEKYKWEIDPVASVHVRTIFEMAMKGNNTSDIARHMNEQGIPTPGMYREQTTGYTQHRKVSDEEWLWDTYTIGTILHNYRYTGALVQGTTAPIRVGGKSRRNVPLKDQVIVDAVFPPIVGTDEFHAAQGAIRMVKKGTLRQKTGFSLGGKIRCGNCGLSMSYQETEYSSNVACRHKRKAGSFSKCDDTIYPAERIEGIVFHALWSKLELFQNLYPVIKKGTSHKHENDEQKHLTAEIETLKTRRIHQYEAYAEGVITKEAYLKSKEELTLQIEDNERKLVMLNELVSSEDNISAQVRDMAAKAEYVFGMKNLTQNVANAFIQSVVIHGPEQMEITFSFDDLLQKTIEKAQELSVSER